MNPESLSINIEQHIEISAPAEAVFAGLVAQMGADNVRPDGVAMPMRLELFPGGRWYRDLGDDAGHFWGHVQVVKPPQLLELTGPLFMSYPVTNFIRYRLTETPTGTRLTLQHQAIGPVADDHCVGVNEGWGMMLQRIKVRCE